jgi:hypothetical protein
MYPKKKKKRNIRIEKIVPLPQVWFVWLQRKISKVLTIPHSSAMHQLTSLLDRVTTHDFLRKMCFSDEIFHVSGARIGTVVGRGETKIYTTSVTWRQ